MKIILFSSQNDDEGGFISANDPCFWDEFNGEECFRFFTHLDEDGQCELTGYDDIAEGFDLLVVWEPPIGIQKGRMHEYEAQLIALAEEIQEAFGGKIASTLGVAYHASSTTECKKLQEQFIAELAEDKQAIFSREYSHIKSDGIYTATAELLYPASTSDEDEGKYFSALKNLKWLFQDYRSLNSLFLLLDLLHTQDVENQQDDVMKWLDDLLNGQEGEDFQKEIEKSFKLIADVELIEEFKSFSKNVCTGDFASCKNIGTLKSELQNFLKKEALV